MIYASHARQVIFISRSKIVYQYVAMMPDRKFKNYTSGNFLMTTEKTFYGRLNYKKSGHQFCQCGCFEEARHKDARLNFQSDTDLKNDCCW